jgi:hypothetical protein
MAEGMAPYMFDDTCFGDGFFYGTVGKGFVVMMPPFFSGFGVFPSIPRPSLIPTWKPFVSVIFNFLISLRQFLFQRSFQVPGYALFSSGCLQSHNWLLLPEINSVTRIKSDARGSSRMTDSQNRKPTSSNSYLT